MDSGALLVAVKNEIIAQREPVEGETKSFDEAIGFILAVLDEEYQHTETILVVRRIWDLIDDLIAAAWNVSPLDYATFTAWTTALSDTWKGIVYTGWGYDNAVLSTTNWGLGLLEYYGVPNTGTTAEKFAALKAAIQAEGAV